VITDEPTIGQVGAALSATDTFGAAERTTPPSWPELIVDIRCADLYLDWLGDAVGHPAPVVVDVARLLDTGARSVLPGAAAIVFGGDTSPDMEPINRLREVAPHVGIYVLTPSKHVTDAALPLLRAAGVDEVFALDVPGTVERAGVRIQHRLGAPAPETEIRLLWRWFRESPERSLVMHCVRNAFGQDDWTLRTQLFGASRRTLQNRMAALGLPSPGLVARCGRMLHAQELERRGVRPAKDVALIIGIPSAAALQRARRRLRRSLLAKGPHALVFASLLR